MKKFLAVISAVLMMLSLSACSSGGNSAEYTENRLKIPSAELSLEIPSEWTVFTGEKVYDSIAESSGGIYTDSSTLKKSSEEQGVSYIAYAQSPDSTIMMTVTVHNMKAGERTEGYTYLDGEEYAHSIHDGIIFEYQMQGCSTRGTGEFSSVTVGNLDCWLSHFEMYLPSDDGDVYILGQYELMTEKNDNMYCIQICYAQGCDESAKSIIDTAGRV